MSQMKAFPPPKAATYPKIQLLIAKLLRHLFLGISRFNDVSSRVNGLELRLNSTERSSALSHIHSYLYINTGKYSNN